MTLSAAPFPPADHAAPWRLRPWMALPPLAGAALPLALSRFCALEPLEARPLQHLDRIASRLEPAVPLAPPLPGLDRDWNRLAPGFCAAVRALIDRMSELGHEFVLLEGFRSPERQAALAASGRNVTRAGADRSLHQYGLAADLALCVEGELRLSAASPGTRSAYLSLGREAEAMGLTWGGRWSFRDLCHVEASLVPADRPWRRAQPPSPTRFPWERP